MPPSTAQAAAGIPRVVYVLGVVSLLTDASAEMINPLLPGFLVATLGAAPWAIGLIEGAAGTMAAVLKVVAGAWSDRLGRRKPFLVAGYALAGVARPLMGLATAWPHVFTLRVLDRVGKGLRTAPRDALIADVTPPERRGQAFGVQRALDHAGAVVGPLVAAALLGSGVPLRDVFLWAGVPAALTLALLLGGVREPRAAPTSPAPAGSMRAVFGSSPAFRRLLASIVVFTLGAAPDAFLVLALTSAGLGAGEIAVVWSGFHVVKLLTNPVGGRWADRFGRKPLLLAGLALHSLAYLGFALVSTSAPVWQVGLLLFYGLHHGALEPSVRAWAADLVPPEQRGVAMGALHAATALVALPGALAFGWVWTEFGKGAAFGVGAVLGAVAMGIAAGVPAYRRARP